MISASTWAQEAKDNPSDWSKIANDVLHRSLQLAPGERVIIQYLPGREPGLIEALRGEIIRSGAIVSAELTWPGEDMAQYFASLSVAQKARLAEVQNDVYREIFAHSDVYLWLDESPLDDLVDRQFEHLIHDSNVRAVHCHFSGAPDPRANPAAWQAYMRAIEEAPSQLKADEDFLIQHLKGSKIHLTSAAGTNLTFEVSPDAWFHENTGDASRDKPRNPLSTRDREEEIPSGDIRTSNVTGVDGKLVAAVGGQPDDTAVLYFTKGRLTRIEPKGEQAKEFAKWFADATGDRDQVGELVIGNNPYLAAAAALNSNADFGHSAGTVRLDIGENWEAGGALRTSDHRQWAFVVTNGTLTAGKQLLIGQGKPIR